jgi:hypothetical protein
MTTLLTSVTLFMEVISNENVFIVPSTNVVTLVTKLTIVPWEV